jgi:hypothetical protein
MRPMPLRPRALILLVLFLSLVPAPLCAAPGVIARGTHFTFTGSVEEAGGRPVRGAKILLLGLREPAAVTDGRGRFNLVYTLPDITALASAPLRLVLCASHKGWNLALASGASALVIELRSVPAKDGGTQLEVRSNDAGAASAVAASFRTHDGATVALICEFLRWLGDEDRTEPVLTALEVVPLDAGPAVAVQTATARPPATRTDPGPAAVAPPDPVRPPAAARSGAASASPVSPSPVPATPRPQRTEVVRNLPSAPVPGRTAEPAPARPPDTVWVRVAQPPIVVPPPDTVWVRVEEPPPPSAPQEPRRSAPPPNVRRAVPATDITARPVIRVSVRPDTTDTLPEAAGSESGAALRVALGRALPGTPSRPAAPEVCECQVKGTVEVRSEKPLSSATWVVVSLADAPAFRDSVTLFMGPPRPFDLGRVPCGIHQLDVQPRTSQRFTVLPPALNEFVCVQKRLQQFQVVLKPR